VYDNLATGHRDLVRWGPLIERDIRDVEAVAGAMADPATVGVVHFAAASVVGASMKAPDVYYDNNVVGALRLMAAAAKRGNMPIILASSAAVYGDHRFTPMAEDARPAPVSPYGETKVAIERALAWHQVAYGLPWAALRYFNAAGADAAGEIGERHDPETHLVPLTIGAALGRYPALTVFGDAYDTPDGTPLRDYIHVDDLASAHVRALQYLLDGGASQPFNLGTGQASSVKTIIETVERVTGRRVPRMVGPNRPGDPPCLVADAGRAESVLGWRALRSDLDTIVATAHRWHSRDWA
jgi:UDP-glucose-4-epimerase GalE